MNGPRAARRERDGRQRETVVSWTRNALRDATRSYVPLGRGSFVNGPTSRLWPRQGQVARVTGVHCKSPTCPDLPGSYVYTDTPATYMRESRSMYTFTCTHAHVCVHTHTQLAHHRAYLLRVIVHNTVPSVSTADRNDSGGERDKIHRLSSLSLFLSFRRPSSPVPGTATDPSIRKFAVLSRGEFVRAGRARGIRGIEHLVVA